MSHVAAAYRTARILFVDDDPNILAAASSLLTALGNPVTTAQTSAQALEQLDAGHYDVLMTDLAMPDISGWDLVKRSKTRFPDKPVILVTGYGLTLDQEEIESGRVNGVLTKPFTMDELRHVLNHLGKR